MSLFDVLSKGFCSKKRESNEILSQEEYKAELESELPVCKFKF